jgi:hypothetical protein
METLSTLVTATRLGLSFNDLNALSFQAFADFTHLWILCEGGENNGPRKATQEDIDALLG